MRGRSEKGEGKREKGEERREKGESGPSYNLSLAVFDVKSSTSTASSSAFYICCTLIVC